MQPTQNDIWFERLKTLLESKLQGTILTRSQSCELSRIIIECTMQDHDPDCDCDDCRNKQQAEMLLNVFREPAEIKP